MHYVQAALLEAGKSSLGRPSFPPWQQGAGSNFQAHLVPVVLQRPSVTPAIKHRSPHPSLLPLCSIHPSQLAFAVSVPLSPAPSAGSSWHQQPHSTSGLHCAPCVGTSGSMGAGMCCACLFSWSLSHQSGLSCYFYTPSFKL